jgi:hypothetical protein
MRWWDQNIFLLLLYTATVTPYEVSFLPSTNARNFDALFYVNRYVDLAFIIDICFNFFTPVQVTRFALGPLDPQLSLVLRSLHRSTPLGIFLMDARRRCLGSPTPLAIYEAVLCQPTRTNSVVASTACRD